MGILTLQIGQWAQGMPSRAYLEDFSQGWLSFTLNPNWVLSATLQSCSKLDEMSLQISEKLDQGDCKNLWHLFSAVCISSYNLSRMAAHVLHD